MLVNIDGWNFPGKVMDYLRERKGEGSGTLEAQVRRSEKQLELLKPLLKRYSPRSMLDIGCGLGLSSIMIAKYSRMNYLGLLDGDGTGELFSDYREGAPAWNDVNIAGIMASSNLHRECRFECFTPPVIKQFRFLPFDLVVSFKSWGTHYPISTYIGMVSRYVEPGGLVVLDLRPGDGPEGEAFRQGQRDEIVAAGFELVQWGFEGDRRHVFRRL